MAFLSRPGRARRTDLQALARIPFAILAALVLFATLAHADQSTTEPQKVVTVEGITEYKLDNGLRFLLFPDASSPTVTVNMTVLVGSRHEGYGETGMAHLLEHMLFKGSKGFPNADKELGARGASFNGTTWVDRTNYYETMPASDANLEFGIKLEADRLVNCFIKREDLAKEMTVVRNEFEMNENNPETILSQRMMAVAFEWHNYGKSTIGNRADIERVPIGNLQAFYRKYYQPDNVVLTIAGKFNQGKAIDYITRYFGALKRPERKLDNTYTEEPPQDGERLVVLRRVGKVPVVGVMYHIPAAPHADFAPLQVLNEILVGGPSSRLYQALVEAKKATSVSGYPFAWFDPGIMEITARVGDQSTTDEVRDILLKNIEHFKPATMEEVERAKQRYKAQRDQALTKSKTIAIELSEWMGAGDWRLLFLNRDRVAKVTPADVDRVARKYLTATNRTLGIYTPTTEVARTVIPPAPPVIDLVKDYKGGKALTTGEAFDPTPANIEKRVKRFKLSGGLKVAFLQKKTRGEAVVGTLALHFGNPKSLLGKNSVCDFAGPMLLKGTKKHTRKEIDDLLNKLSAKLQAGSDMGVVSVSLQAKRQTLPEVLDLLREALREPTFPEKEFDILQRAEIQGAEEALTDPQTLARIALRRALNPLPKEDIRYVPTIEEEIERVKATTRDQVAKLYEEQVGAQAGELVLVGDFDADAAMKQLEEMFSGWKSEIAFQRIPRKVIPVKGSTKDIVTPDKENAVYVAGETFALSDTAPDYPALSMGNYLLGGSPTSRLFERLRQKEGLSYGAGSILQVESKDPFAALVMFAICNPKVIDKADKAALEVFNETLKKGVTQKELADGKKSLLQEMQVSRARDDRLAGTLRQGLYLGRTYAYYADLEKKIAALTVDDVNQALRRYLSPARLTIIRAGDFKNK
ncbi:MAG: insulinase family protein [Planctomycetes bacterium]|nr:insulinase family protein [Planctomycetota bacterium]